MRVGEADGKPIRVTPPESGKPPTWSIGEKSYDSPMEFVGAINRLAADGKLPASAMIDRKAVRKHHEALMSVQRETAARSLSDIASRCREHGDEAGAAAAEESRRAILGE